MHSKIAVMVLGTICVCYSAEPSSDMSAAVEASRLRYKSGTVSISGNLATIDVPKTFRFLEAEDAEYVLHELWGNPAGTNTLGMLVPTDISPTSKDGWAIVVTYEEDGFVEDSEASKIDYDEVLKTMKQQALDGNAERKKNGYPAIELVGWAEKPHYDTLEHKLYWAKELRFGNSPETTLNYNIRVLGRRGVLVLNAVANKGQLETVNRETAALLKRVNFTAGSRYSDFIPSADKVAAYGIGGLIAGKVAAKVGLLKWLIGLALAGKKWVLLALAGIGARLFRRKKAPSPEPTLDVLEPAAASAEPTDQVP